MKQLLAHRNCSKRRKNNGRDFRRLSSILDASNGAVACQIMDAVLFAQTTGRSKVPMRRVRWSARSDYEILENLKVLQNALIAAGSRKQVPVEDLLKGTFQAVYAWMSWLRCYVREVMGQDSGRGSQEGRDRGQQVGPLAPIGYDAKTRRRQSILGAQVGVKAKGPYQNEKRRRNRVLATKQKKGKEESRRGAKVTGEIDRNVARKKVPPLTGTAVKGHHQRNINLTGTKERKLIARAQHIIRIASERTTHHNFTAIQSVSSTENLNEKKEQEHAGDVLVCGLQEQPGPQPVAEIIGDEAFSGNRPLSAFLSKIWNSSEEDELERAWSDTKARLCQEWARTEGVKWEKRISGVLARIALREN